MTKFNTTSINATITLSGIFHCPSGGYGGGSYKEEEENPDDYIIGGIEEHQEVLVWEDRYKCYQHVNPGSQYNEGVTLTCKKAGGYTLKVRKDIDFLVVPKWFSESYRRYNSSKAGYVGPPRKFQSLMELAGEVQSYKPIDMGKFRDLIIKKDPGLWSRVSCREADSIHDGVKYLIKSPLSVGKEDYLGLMVRVEDASRRSGGMSYVPKESLPGPFWKGGTLAIVCGGKEALARILAEAGVPPQEMSKEEVKQFLLENASDEEVTSVEVQKREGPYAGDSRKFKEGDDSPLATAARAVSRRIGLWVGYYTPTRQVVPNGWDITEIPYGQERYVACGETRLVTQRKGEYWERYLHIDFSASWLEKYWLQRLEVIEI